MNNVVKVLLVLAAIWIALAVIGLIVKGLFVLFVIGAVALGATLALSAARRGITRR